ncbi:MAG: hypothetical protein U9P12_09520 [Verrucomicrobiota bacterium]|nr:hypothetical protein [Verrucomicrobiota bacterium]
MVFYPALAVLVASAFAQERFELKLVDPLYPDQPAKSYDVVLEKDEHGFPLEYCLLLKTKVCLDGTCEELEATLKWDALGRFSRLEHVEDAPLAKGDLKPFSAEDYVQLDQILRNRRSILGAHPLDFFLTHPTHQSTDVDGITAATPQAVKGAVVDGAAYTSWTLWHWANGEVVSQLYSQTLSLADADYLLQCLNSSDRRFVRFALDRLLEDGLEDPRQQTAIFHILESGGQANCTSALQLLLEASDDLDQVHQKLIGLIGKNGGSSQLILAYLKEQPGLDLEIWVGLAEQLKHIPGYRDLDGALAVLTEHANGSPEVRSLVAQLLESEDRFVVRRAAIFLEQ